MKKKEKQDREQYSKFFTLSVDPMCIADPFGCFKDVNPAFMQLTGYAKDELVSKPYLDLVLPADRQRTADEARLQASARPTQQYENHYVCKDGKVVLLLWTAYFDKSDGLIYATARDVTDQRLKEDELRRTAAALRSSEAQLREAQRVAGVGSWEWIIDTDTNIWSDELYRIFGRDPKLFSPNYCTEHTELYTPESWARLQAAVEEALRSGTPYELDLEFLRPDRTSGWLVARGEAVRDETGQIILLRGTGLEITDRKRAEHVAREQFKLAEAFFNHSVNSLVVLDREFNFLRVNEAYARACRLDISGFAGRNHFEMFPSDAKAIFEEVVRTKKPFHTFERAFDFPDQPERGVTWWEWTLVPVLDGQGEVEYLVFSLNEVTERRRAREVVEQSVRQVQALSARVMKVQQEERDRLARELHDELGQTLTALKVNLQMLESYYIEGEAESHLAEALAITARALEQVRNIALDLHPLGLEELGLAATLQSQLAKLAGTAGWDAHFEATTLIQLRPEVKIVVYRIVQEALTNIMRHAQAKQVWVTLGLYADKVYLSVRDDGKGFDVAAISDASTPRSLGLIGMRERARQMAGELTIHSVPGRGTEVRANFPIEPLGGAEPEANASTQA